MDIGESILVNESYFAATPALLCRAAYNRHLANRKVLLSVGFFLCGLELAIVV